MYIVCKHDMDSWTDFIWLAQQCIFKVTNVFFINTTKLYCCLIVQRFHSFLLSHFLTLATRYWFQNHLHVTFHPNLNCGFSWEEHQGGNISSKGTPVSISSAYALPPAQSISEGLILNLMAYMELDLDEKFTKCKCKCVIPVRKEKLSLVG